MSDYASIFCALDFSAATERIGARAAMLARCCSARLTLVHIIDPTTVRSATEPLPAELPWLAIPIDQPLTDANLQAVVDDAEDNLMQWAQRLVPKPPPSPVATEVMLSSSARDAICELAQRGGADLIVVGSHGPHGLALFSHDATSAGVLHNAPCDVLVVQGGAAGN